MIGVILLAKKSLTQLIFDGSDFIKTVYFFINNCQINTKKHAFRAIKSALKPFISARILN